MIVAVVDPGSGNLNSVARALTRAGELAGLAPEIRITRDAEQVRLADRVVLPGQGAFAACRSGLADLPGMTEALAEVGLRRARPFLGICVGMQMMATCGREYKDTQGFDWIAGDVVRITPADPALKVPHMGWNDLVLDQVHPVLAGIATGDHAYFVHSYQFRVTNPAHRLAHVDYGGDVTAIIGNGTMIGTQFHPEKSQQAGLRLIANFLTWSP